MRMKEKKSKFYDWVYNGEIYFENFIFMSIPFIILLILILIIKFFRPPILMGIVLLFAIFIGPIISIFPILLNGLFIKERNGVSKRIILRRYMTNPNSYWNSVPKFDQLSDEIINSFDKNNIVCEIIDKASISKYTHQIIYRLPNHNVYLRVGKIAQHYNNEFIFVFYSDDKGKQIYPKKLMKIIDSTFLKL